MADIKLTGLTEKTTLVETDIVLLTSDPAGVPASRKATVKTLLDTRLNYSIVGSSNFTLGVGTAVQPAFSATGDVFTLIANTTYQVEGLYVITKSGTTCTTGIAFALGGGATIASMKLHVQAVNAAANTTSTAVSSTWINQVAATVVNVTAVGEVVIRFVGLIRMTAGGTVTPQIIFSAAPTSPVMVADSFIEFTPIGTTNNTLGIVA